MEGIACHPKHGPIVHRLGAKAAVESDGGLVPVENRPFQSSAVALDRELGEVDEQLPADPAAPPRRFHEKILEVQAALADKRREILKEQREAGGLRARFGNHDLGARRGAEQRVAQARFGRGDFVGEPLVVGEATNQFENERHVALGGGSNRQFHSDHTINHSERQNVYSLASCASRLPRRSNTMDTKDTRQLNSYYLGVLCVLGVDSAPRPESRIELT